MLKRSHPERWHELRLLAEDPANRELTRRDTPTLRKVVQVGDELGVRVTIRCAEPRHVDARVVLTERAGREEPTRKHAVQRRASRPEYSRPVRRAVEHIRDRFGDPITLNVLADHAGLDKFHLCRAFRAQIGLPPHKYLMHVRVARAKEHLFRGVPASEVAALVGFYDQAQLTRHFRRIVGTPPARWPKSSHDPKVLYELRLAQR